MTLVISIILNIILFSYFKKFSNFLNIYDFPSTNKIHASKVSLIGGYIFYLNYLFFFVSDFFFNANYFYFIFDDAVESKIIFFILSHFILIIAMVDDKINLRASTRLILLFLTSGMLIYSCAYTQLDFIKSHFFDIIYLNNSKFLLSILILVVLVNFLNFYDGINLQFGIYFSFILLYLLILDFNIIILYFLVINIFFLIFNYKKKMFLGDFGVYTISILLSLFLLHYYRSLDYVKLENILILFFFPIIDFCRLIFIRIINNQNPMSGDKNHIHHICLKKYGLIKYNLIMVLIYTLNLIGLFLHQYLILILSNFLVYLFLIRKN